MAAEAAPLSTDEQRPACSVMQEEQSSAQQLPADAQIAVEVPGQQLKQGKVEGGTITRGGPNTTKAEPTVVVFLNSKSGGQMGPVVIKAMLEQLPADRVYDLKEVMEGKWAPEDKLRQWQSVDNLRILVCGGDGTMGWIMSCIDRLEASNDRFPIAMMPLGTGNDLSRSFHWGPGFKDKMLLPKFLRRVTTAEPTKLDRWLLCVMPYEPLGDAEAIKKTHIPPTFTIHQYKNTSMMGNINTQVARKGDTYTAKMAEQANRTAEQEQVERRRPRAPGEPEEKLDDDDGSSSSSSSDDETEKDGKPRKRRHRHLHRHRDQPEGTAVVGEEKVTELAEATIDEKPEMIVPPLHPMPSQTVLVKHKMWESYDGVFCNYFSIGVDAVAAAAFHQHREAHPELFTSRMRNQLWYIRKGFPAAGGLGCMGTKAPRALRKYTKMRVRRAADAEWEDVKIPRGTRGVIVLNLQSYGGGRDLWGGSENCGPSKFLPASPSDGLLEVVGISNIQKLGAIMGLNKFGVHARKLVQAHEIEFKVRDETYMQIDGEPWKQAAATVAIKHYARSTVLVKDRRKLTETGAPEATAEG